MSSNKKLLKKRENKKNNLKTNFTVFLYRPEKHESTVHFPTLQHSYPTFRDLFRSKSPSLIFEEENTYCSQPSSSTLRHRSAANVLAVAEVDPCPGLSWK